MKTPTPESWGRFPREPQKILPAEQWIDSLPVSPTDGGTYLPFGNGRSYGDVCLNSGGTLIPTRALNRVLAFEEETGVLKCEAGILLHEILDRIVGKGWFLPVTPGTQFVTVGGAIANDVHGKNHHCLGTFGCHVTRFELLRSDGTRMICSGNENPDWFRATIGGLGLTGLITWAEISLKPIKGPLIDQEVIRFEGLDDFFSLADESDEAFEYTVAWIDSLAKGGSQGRGLFIRGDHSEERTDGTWAPAKPRIRVPFTPPASLVNQLTLRVFNSVYYRRPIPKGKRPVPLTPFFYPLDAIGDWNRIYGPRGLLQHQCVLPERHGGEALSEMLGRISGARTGSFLAVLKRFGAKPSPGILSFPRPGITLALDFPNQGRRTLKLLETLDEIVRDAGGALNPSKDARMTAGSFQMSFPHSGELEQFVDPAFSSSFWRRVVGIHEQERKSDR